MDTLCPTARGNVNILDFFNFIKNKILSSTCSSVCWLPQKLLEGFFGLGVCFFFFPLTCNGLLHIHHMPFAAWV